MFKSGLNWNHHLLIGIIMESELRWLKELEVSIHVRLVFTMCGWTLNMLLSLKKWNTTWNDTNPKPLWCLRGYTSFEPSDEKYCRWKGSCTSWYGKSPSIYRVLYMPGGAGFLPSTVAQIYILLLKSGCLDSSQNIQQSYLTMKMIPLATT